MIVLFALFCLFSLCRTQTTAQYYVSTQSGQGTYYGYSNNGACTLTTPLPSSGINGINLTVAMNTAQYGTSEVCGTCLEVWGNGQGAGANPIIGPYRVFVADECPTCKSGDLDFSVPGDGRWNIQWYAVDCNPTGSVQYMFQGSNQYYIKLQVRNTVVPIQSVQVKQGGQWIILQRTSDNFFVNPGNTPSGGYTFPMPVSFTSIDQQTLMDSIPSLQNSVIQGNVQFNNFQGVPSSGNKLSGGAVAAIVIVVLFVVGLSAGIVIFAFWRRHHGKPIIPRFRQ